MDYRPSQHWVEAVCLCDIILFKLFGKVGLKTSPDPDEKAPIRVYTVCHSACIFLAYFYRVKPHCSNFSAIKQFLEVSEN